MRILPVVAPSKEQLTILLENRPGVFIVNGAAGSGKTTTALLRLRDLCGKWLNRKRRLGLTEPVRVLVLTYNKTLGGYISELAETQVSATSTLSDAVASGELHLQVSTYAKWAVDLLGYGSTPDADECRDLLARFSVTFGLPERFVADEVEYVLGRFSAAHLEEYLTTSRDGRGTTPRMEATNRRRLLDTVIYPYLAAKTAQRLRDWNDIDAEVVRAPNAKWDIVIVDEAQDFSANQIRALMAHVAGEHSVTFVMDTAQRIYPRSFTWREAGVSVVSSRRLGTNFRNTQQIAAFARSVLDGMSIGDDGTLPDFTTATAVGPKPTLLLGRYSAQLDWAIANVVRAADLRDESVAFLQPLGGAWFSALKQGLDVAQVPWVQLTRASTWPGGTETVALSTIHSAKGLEFDHVVILGLNQQVTPHGSEDGDSQFEALRRLLAMGIGRARRTVTVGFKPGEGSTLIGLLDSATYDQVIL